MMMTLLSRYHFGPRPLPHHTMIPYVDRKFRTVIPPPNIRRIFWSKRQIMRFNNSDRRRLLCGDIRGVFLRVSAASSFSILTVFMSLTLPLALFRNKQHDTQRVQQTTSAMQDRSWLLRAFDSDRVSARKMRKNISGHCARVLKGLSLWALSYHAILMISQTFRVCNRALTLLSVFAAASDPLLCASLYISRTKELGPIAGSTSFDEKTVMTSPTCPSMPYAFSLCCNRERTLR